MFTSCLCPHGAEVLRVSAISSNVGGEGEEQVITQHLRHVGDGRKVSRQRFGERDL